MTSSPPAMAQALAAWLAAWPAHGRPVSVGPAGPVRA